MFYQLPINNGIIRINSGTTVNEEKAGADGAKPYKAPITEIDRRRNLAIIFTSR